MPKLSAEKLRERIAELEDEYEQVVAHQYDDLLVPLTDAAHLERAARELKVELARRALKLLEEGQGPSRRAIAEAALISPQATHQKPYKD